jgi:hypothetical protein
MKTLAALISVAAVTFAIGGSAQAKSAWDQLSETAPRSDAPFGQLEQTAPRSGPVLELSARGLGFEDLERTAP